MEKLSLLFGAKTRLQLIHADSSFSLFLSDTPPTPPPFSGYIVFSGPRRANGVQGLRFIIQSEKAPHYLEGRVEAFLCTMEKSLEEMSDEAFQKHIQALAIRRLDKPKKLSAECAKHWGEIISQQYNFDRGEAHSVAPPTAPRLLKICT